VRYARAVEAVRSLKRNNIRWENNIKFNIKYFSSPPAIAVFKNE